MHHPTKEKRVLVVEDNLIASKAAQMILEASGWLVDCVYNGHDALDHLDEKYDLILLDLGLPDMDGFTIANAIRNSQKPLAKTVIVIVTALDSKRNRDLARQLGISHYIAKPFTMEKCDRILKQMSELASA